MTMAWIYSKSPDGAVDALVNTCGSEEEAWAWVREHDCRDRNVVVASGADIQYGWKLVGANREDEG